MASSSAQGMSCLNSHLQANGAAIPSEQAGYTPESLQLSTNMDSSRPTPHDSPSYAIAEAYEAKLCIIKNGALLVAGLQKISRFFGICALTWATVVLLGGFASSLKPLDFYLISILLLLEAARLSTTQVFSKLLSKTLFRERHRPEEFQYEDLQYYWASRLDIVGQGSSCLVAIVGLAFVSVRLGISRQHPLLGGDGSNSNLTPSLYTFYVLIILISIPAIVSGVCRLFLRRSTEDSLMCYHDEVYKTAMEVGMPEADDLDYFDFAFKKLTRDHMRNIRPLMIKKHNKDLIHYMYHSQNGVELTCEHLRSSDVCKQQVAANLPGFWEGERRIEKQVALFWALRDRLYGPGKVAEGAANSLQGLARSWVDRKLTFEQHPFLINDPSKLISANVVDTLVDLVVQSIKPSLIFQIRALESCCRHSQVLQHIYSQGNQQQSDADLCGKLQAMIVCNQQEELSRPGKLCRKLKSVLSAPQGSSGRERTKIYAANALYALLCFQGELSRKAKESLKKMVDEIDPARELNPAAVDDDKGPRAGNGSSRPKRAEPYVWQDEKQMLDDLRVKLGSPRYMHWHRLEILTKGLFTRAGSQGHHTGRQPRGE